MADIESAIEQGLGQKKKTIRNNLLFTLIFVFAVIFLPRNPVQDVLFWLALIGGFLTTIINIYLYVRRKKNYNKLQNSSDYKEFQGQLEDRSVIRKQDKNFQYYFSKEFILIIDEESGDLKYTRFDNLEKAVATRFGTKKTNISWSIKLISRNKRKYKLKIYDELIVENLFRGLKLNNVRIEFENIRVLNTDRREELESIIGVSLDTVNTSGEDVKELKKTTRLAFPSSLDFDQIKVNSGEYMLGKGVEVNKHLPVLEDYGLKNIDEITKRAMVLHAQVNIFYQAPISVIKKWLKDNDLWDCLSNSERDFFEEVQDRSLPKGNQMATNFFWYMEALYALLWSLGLFEEIDPTKSCPDRIASLMPDIQKNEKAIFKGVDIYLREKTQVYQMADLYYRAHWYAMDGQVGGYNTGKFNLDSIMERRKALWWVMIEKADWDKVPMDT